MKKTIILLSLFLSFYLIHPAVAQSSASDQPAKNKNHQLIEASPSYQIYPSQIKDKNKVFQKISNPSEDQENKEQDKDKDTDLSNPDNDSIKRENIKIINVDDKKTKIFDVLYYYQDDLAKLQNNNFNLRSKSFDLSSSAGPLWVIVLYRAFQDSYRGESVFEIMPENITVRMGENIFSFKAVEMVSYLDKNPLTVDYAGITITEDQIKRYAPEEYQKIQEIRLKEFKDLKQTIVVKKFHFKENEPSSLMVDLISNKHLQPYFMEIVIGQGEIPPKLPSISIVKNLLFSNAFGIMS